MKLKPLVIVHQNVTVKLSQALHTPPITLEKVSLQERFREVVFLQSGM